MIPLTGGLQHSKPFLLGLSLFRCLGWVGPCHSGEEKCNSISSFNPVRCPTSELSLKPHWGFLLFSLCPWLSQNLEWLLNHRNFLTAALPTPLHWFLPVFDGLEILLLLCRSNSQSSRGGPAMPVPGECHRAWLLSLQFTPQPASLLLFCSLWDVPAPQHPLFSLTPGVPSMVSPRRLAC